MREVQPRHINHPDPPTGSGVPLPWRSLPWLVACAVLLAPAVAMRFTDEVDWDAADFVLMAALLGGACAAFDLALRRTRNLPHLAGMALAVGTCFLLVWSNLAVGLIGEPGNAINGGFFAVPAVGVAGAVLSRLQPGGMARTLAAMAITLALVGAVALGFAPALEVFVLCMAFIAPLLASAWLFRLAGGVRKLA